MAAVLMAVSLVATPLVARAEDHKRPDTGLPCNNTYVDVTHVGFAESYEIPGHELSNGERCIPTRLVYAHQISCSTCKAVIKNWSYFYCEEYHSACGTVIKGIGH